MYRRIQFMMFLMVSVIIANCVQAEDNTTEDELRTLHESTMRHSDYNLSSYL